MTGSEPGAIVSMEVLVKQNVILPMRIFLEFSGSAVNRTLAICVTHKDAAQAAPDFFCYLEQRHVVARTGRTLDLEVISVERIHGQQAANDERIHWHPNWPTPIGITPKHTGVGFSR